MEYIRLSNGVEMPLLGYGVFQVSPDECERCVTDALSVGYRLIDTAQAYQNEEGVGAAWRKSGLKREDLFLGTEVMAWGPLGGQGAEGIVKSEVLASIGAKYNKTAAQVALRWLTQRGIVVIPKSTHKERMEQNFDIFDFTLSDDDMSQIATLNQQDAGFINFGDPQFVKYLIENYG